MVSWFIITNVLLDVNLHYVIKKEAKESIDVALMIVIKMNRYSRNGYTSISIYFLTLRIPRIELGFLHWKCSVKSHYTICAPYPILPFKLFYKK